MATVTPIRQGDTQIMKGLIPAQQNAADNVAAAAAEVAAGRAVVTRPADSSARTGGGGGGNGGGAGGASGRWKGIFGGSGGKGLRVVRIILVACLLIATLKIGNYYAEANRESELQSKIASDAASLVLRQSAANVAKIEATAALETAKTERYKVQTDAMKVSPETPIIPSATIFGCETKEKFSKGFASATPQSFSGQFRVPQGCALVLLTYEVGRVVGRKFHLEYPIRGSDQVYRCGPEEEKTDCAASLNLVQSTNGYPDKSWRAVVDDGGYVEFYPKGKQQ